MAKRIETLKERKKKFEHKDWLKYVQKFNEKAKAPFKSKSFKPPLELSEPQLYPIDSTTMCPPDENWEPEGFFPGNCVPS